jgi:hypothetical protein
MMETSIGSGGFNLSVWWAETGSGERCVMGEGAKYTS